MVTLRLMLDAETIHNWHSYWSDTIWAKKLPPQVRAAIDRAYEKHNRHGANPQELAEQLCKQFPVALMC